MFEMTLSEGTRYWLHRLMTRPRALLRAWKRIGFVATVRLVLICFGSPERLYKIRVPQWPHPVFVRGGKSSDTTVLYEILVTGEYDFTGDLDNPRTIIDGGANVGFAALYFLNQYPMSRVISVEPFPETAAVCRRNLAPYGERAVVLEGAIWPGEASVCLDPQGEEFINRVRPAAAAEHGSVRTFTMESLVKRCGGEVNLLKLDVEGSEKEIFDETAERWLPYVRDIVIEFHGRECEEQIFSALAEYEFEQTKHDSVYFLHDLRHEDVVSHV